MRSSLSFAVRFFLVFSSSLVVLSVCHPFGLAVAVSVLVNIKGVGIIHLSGQDVVRHPVVARILQAYEAGQK